MLPASSSVQRIDLFHVNLSFRDFEMKWAELEVPILQSPGFDNLRVPDWVNGNVLMHNAVPFD
jgi:hypothetical protein